MQTLDVISVNVWQILISLINLTLLFLLIKKFLWKPVKKVMKARQDELEAQYADARRAQDEADGNKRDWEEKIKSAESEADSILKKATENADRRSEKIIGDARDKAEAIVRQAESEALLERKKADESIKKEIVVLSSKLTEKMLKREINEQDQRNLINSFIDEMGEKND